MDWKNATKYLLIVPLLLPSLTLRAQCSGGNNVGTLSPTAAWQTISFGDGDYRTITVTGSGCNFPTYYFSFCAADGGSASFDTQITILNSSLVSVAYSDDNCGVQSYIAWTPSAAGTYRVLVNTYSCGDFGNTGTLAYSMSPPPPSNPNFTMVQSATTGATSNCVQLTPNANGMRGCGWNNVNSLNFAMGFSHDFTVNLGNSDGGADGIAFVLHNDPDGLCACGDFGGAMGAANIQNGLMVEIDTYMNYEDRDDFCAGDFVGCAGTNEWDHLDVWTGTNFNPNLDANCNGVVGGERPYTPCAVPLKNLGALYNIENGTDHKFRVSWTPGSPGTLTASVMNLAGTVTYGTISYAFTALTLFGTNTPYFGFTAATGGLSNQHSFCLSSTVLPTAMQSFAAQHAQGKVRLTWQSEDERYLLNYRVERSRDLMTWEAVGEKPAAGAGADYHMEDAAPLHGLSHYRLVVVQRQGGELASEVRSVVVEGRRQVVLSPNPARDVVKVQAWGLGTDLHVTVLDMQGRVVARRPMEVEALDLHLGAFPAGVYLVQVSGSEGTGWSRLVKD